MFNVKEVTSFLSKQKSLEEFASIVNHKIVVDLQDVSRPSTKAYITTRDMTRMLDDKISTAGMRLYLYLYENSNASRIPQVKEMCEALGLSRSVVSAAKKLLIDKGYMYEDKLTRGAHKSHIVFLGRGVVGWARSKVAIRELMERSDNPYTNEQLTKLAHKRFNEEFEVLLLSTQAMSIYNSEALRQEALQDAGQKARSAEAQLAIKAA